MTTLQRVAQVFGWVFVVVAIWGAVVSGTTMTANPEMAPLLWGLFPINLLHNLVHLAFGIWGILAARSSHRASRTYAVWAGGIYILLSILGVFFPAGFGLVPIGGNDIWLHAVLGVALLVAGATLASRGATGTVEPASKRTVTPPAGAGTGAGTGAGASPGATPPPTPPASSPEGTATRPPAGPTEPASDAEPVADEPRRGQDIPPGPGPEPREGGEPSSGGPGDRTP